jgi:hypothetical protein
MPPREIPYDKLARLMVEHGWDQAVVYYRREGHDGGEGVTTAGLTYRDAEIAREMGDFLKSKVFGWKSEESAELDKMITEAKKEMAESPEGGDPDTGKRLIDTSHTKMAKRKRK